MAYAGLSTAMCTLQTSMPLPPAPNRDSNQVGESLTHSILLTRTPESRLPLTLPDHFLRQIRFIVR
jgi:hypothetical protein